MPVIGWAKWSHLVIYSVAVLIPWCYLTVRWASEISHSPNVIELCAVGSFLYFPLGCFLPLDGLYIHWGRVAGKFGKKMFYWFNDYFLHVWHLCVTGISWVLVQRVRLCNSALRTQLCLLWLKVASQSHDAKRTGCVSCHIVCHECIFTLHCSNHPFVPSLFIILKRTICRYSGSVLALIITTHSQQSFTAYITGVRLVYYSKVCG